MSLLRGWAAHRPVRRTAASVLVAILAGVATSGWRIVSDGSTVAVAALAHGPRYLVLPLVLLAVVASALAGAISASSAACGLAAVVATTFPSVRRGRVALVIVGGAGAAALTLSLGSVLAAAAAGMLRQVGGDGHLDAAIVVDVAVLVGRAALVAGGLGALASALGLLLPGSSLPAMASSVGVLAVEAALLPVTSGRLDLVGASLAISIVGPDQVVRLGHPPSLALAVSLLVVVATTAVALLIGLAANRVRPLPS